MLRKILDKYEDVALSNNDILKKLRNRANIALYPDLYKYRNIDDLLGPYGAVVLLFESEPKYGHWVCIFKRDSNTIEFFNPYGGYPDDSLLQINKEFRKQSGQIYPILSILLLESPYYLTYNEFQFQKHGMNVKTCGRHCIVRLLFRNLDLYDYHDMLDKIKNEYELSYDEIVTLLTL
jgi:hypothetical protein